MRSILANTLGVLCALIVVAVFTGAIPAERTAFFILTIVGMTMCAIGGIGPAQARLGWSHPLTIIGSAIGVLALFTVVAVLLDWATPRNATAALAGLMAVKWAIGLIFLRSAAPRQRTPATAA